MIRALAKKTLKNSTLFKPAQSIYIKLKFYLDWVIFKTIHPGSTWIAYNSLFLSELHKKGFYSQFGQDFFIENFFERAYGKNYHGFFVDIGANHPIYINNSYFFEIKGWRGIAVDPLKTFVNDWKELRSTILHNIAISESIGKKEFVQICDHEGWEHTLSGFSDCVRNEDIYMYDCMRYTVDTTPLTEIIPINVKIDLLLIDVEGAEKYVIQGAHLDVLRPKAILIENAGRLGGDNKIRKTISDYRYKLHARIGATDDLFVRCD